MEKKKLITGIVTGIVGLALVGTVAYLYVNLDNQKKENKAMQELAELDKKEMENEYQQFATQYSEMKTQISNDSIIAQLTAEQEKTERLLKELKDTKSNDAREIARLKRELATVRAVLRSYVIEIDSLNRLNQNLTAENSRIKGQYNEATRQIEGLNSERASLSEKVAIAAQLDATGISMQLKNKKGKKTDKTSKCKTVQVNFTIAKNVTASNGTKTFYVRITSPSGTTLGGGGTFNYQNRSLEATMRKAVEYDGRETTISTFWNVSQSLMAGTYQVSVFADGNMIGSRSFSFK
ncbi:MULTISPECIES: hypothetical protein [unclassified Prevotella]|jgi:predicted  nucleic acid-binding Zn-ribbon protein|uniref:hypothetical protein n=1 Tax=unclassified Prevotella TaxID=2638335 RepID=UPI000B9FF3CA|nr:MULTISPECIES: hypothetical protein [unclassified Prevotella]OZT04566.1 hypothetical protein CHL74_04615 [Prevotella sp. 885]